MPTDAGQGPKVPSGAGPRATGVAAHPPASGGSAGLWPLVRQSPAWLTFCMFTGHEVTLGLDFPAARNRLTLLLRGDWLDSVSRDAYAEGLTGQLRVGPFGPVRGVSKLVQVSLLEPVPHDDMVVMPLRWEATGVMGRLFPVLDANLVLSRNDDNRAVLRLNGVYRPPLDGVGEDLDQIVLNRVATATVKSLLARIAALLAGAADEEDEAAGPQDQRPGLRTNGPPRGAGAPPS